MGVPTSEVGYTPVMPRSEDHEVHKRHVVALGGGNSGVVSHHTKMLTGSEGSRKLRFPDYVTTAQDGGKVVSFMHHPPLHPGNTPGTHFC